MLLMYLLSSSTGLNKGIKWLSNIELGLCLLLLLFVFFAAPTVFILNAFVLGLVDYLTNFVQYSLRLSPYLGKRGCVSGRYSTGHGPLHGNLLLVHSLLVYQREEQSVNLYLAF